MNIDQFRRDFLVRVKDSGSRQIDLVREYGVQQAALSRFMRGKNGLSLESVIALWPFVYGKAFPRLSPRGLEHE